MVKPHYSTSINTLSIVGGKSQDMASWHKSVDSFGLESEEGTGGVDALLFYRWPALLVTGKPTGGGSPTIYGLLAAPQTGIHPLQDNNHP